MPSSKARISSSPPKPARSCTTTRPSFWRTATAGRPRSRATSNWMPRTDDRSDKPLRDDDAPGPGNGQGDEPGDGGVLAQGVRGALADHAERVHGNELWQGHQQGGA